MGKYFLLWMLCCCGLSTLAQDTVQKKTIVAAEIGSPGIGLSAEWNHGSPFTVETSAFLGPSYNFEDEFLAFILTPSYSKPAVRFSITPRFYVNMKDRLKPRKRKYTQVDLYVGLGYSYVTRSFDAFNPDAHLITGHLGFRQFFSERGIITAHLGLGYAASRQNVSSTFYPSLSLRIGYRLNN